MKKLILSLLLIPAVIFAQERRVAVVVNPTNSVLLSPTNFLIVNATNMATQVQATHLANFTIPEWQTISYLVGDKEATLPTAVGNTNRTYTIVCKTAGTNAILTTGGQTISGFTKWTNTAVNKYVTVASDNTNWFVVNASVPP